MFSFFLLLLLILMIIKYGFTSTGRKIAKILKDVDKDYSKVFKNEL